ncbi:hypothetical protein BDP81DRAFT_89969 [Colletotrichum phormii]|uniref:Uncharacterized protein n=1 Tax=Colletotrichum phormii TaxID=359342 RepID=A0AAJ0A4D7_9PEZI|nr:uncharacterized protein BDP81DRAFT_89969 [Colletotrichum phormii]KAK1654866.1 hypothetical protein BDP81DRAFT_89969 [Colletotrichum phormii]
MESGSLLCFSLFSSALLRIHYHGHGTHRHGRTGFNPVPNFPLNAPQFPANVGLGPICKSEKSLSHLYSTKHGDYRWCMCLKKVGGGHTDTVRYGYSSFRRGKKKEKKNETRPVPTASMISISWGRNTGGGGRAWPVEWLPDVFGSKRLWSVVEDKAGTRYTTPYRTRVAPPSGFTRVLAYNSAKTAKHPSRKFVRIPSIYPA